ncbi:hypothetical protein FRC10_008840 [Ceratobasidium sp. 414]|nr:hypothetical protein FRC10_008840 [Ceratobasidium sp. 414]
MHWCWIGPVPMVCEDDLWRLADTPRGKRKRRVGNTIIYESESVKEDTSIEHSNQTPTLDDCGQSFYPTSVTHSTSIKRKASIQVSPGEGSKKRKGSGSAGVAELQVEDVITSSTYSRINQTQPPAIHENNAHSSFAVRPPLKSHSDPTPMPQCNRRVSRLAPGRRHSLNTMFARLGRTQRAESDEQRDPFPVLLASEPVTISDTISGEEAYYLTQEPDQLGRRKALLIAIQYEGQHWRGPKTPQTRMFLRGSYADARDIRSLLIAGHGTQVDDKNGDEDDGKDEDLPEQHPPDLAFWTNGIERDANGKIGARVICFAACTDSQEAYSSRIGEQWRGRFTRAFTQGVRNFRLEVGGKRNPTIQELHDSVTEQLKDENNAPKGIVQNPVLTTSFKKTAGDWQKPIEF